ncbi:SusD/RagB family nutrient-binding outer membrane lipoprotein [Sediminitomix flava]|uniref:SusD-like starch-binding protein associating with outer membrane n=1 Tax=Sediminitomix flava TaxID=379075 RepID=A0A315ZB83_SEDFL|nr:SusD/RagB family nutrient-binding outer membrane lipoprotein [Sediminitomix flava]PWJ42835.1 SusD-like starch-binding protein associating with outer membrane [Sediminitomix flava]
MTMKFFNKTIKVTAFAVAALFSSCDHFEEMNVNPNLPSQAATSGLLSNAQIAITGRFVGSMGHLGSQYTQQVSQVEYPAPSNYDDSGQSSFASVYSGALIDLKEIIKLCNDPDKAEKVVVYGNLENQKAVAEILSVWAFQNVTDVWGDVPYSEALKGDEGLFLSKYDTQEEIYDDLIARLTAASAAIKVDGTPKLEGDLFFGSEESDVQMMMWKKFANSLRLRMAMRLSEVNSSKADALINDADFDEILSSSDEVVALYHLSTEAEANPIYYTNVIAAGGDNIAISNIMVDHLTSLNDPRLASYATPSDAASEYIGVPYGMANDVALSISQDDFSLIGGKFADQDAPSIVMTASEVLFIKAEAIARGYISGGATEAEKAYNDAITTSMEFNGVATDDITTYLAQTSVAYDNANWRAMIGEQKWLALYMQGVEAWSEWRRLDYPTLTPSANGIINQIPRRRAYASDEYSTNTANVEAAATRITGGDFYTSTVWWDK